MNINQAKNIKAKIEADLQLLIDECRDSDIRDDLHRIKLTLTYLDFFGKDQNF